MMDALIYIKDAILITITGSVSMAIIIFAGLFIAELIMDRCNK